MEELIIGDKTYVSSKRASEITGYAKDYVGQLCREGRVQATLVGRSWYVLESSIREHCFGAPETPAVAPEEPVAPGIGLTWTSPVYKSEVMKPIIEEERIEEESVLENMQSAWQDWFKSRGEATEKVEPAEEAPEAQNSPVEAIVFTEVEEEPEIEQSIPVNISMIEEPVPLVRVYREEVEAEEPIKQSTYIDTEEIVVEAPRKSSYVARSLVLVFAGIAVLIAFIGSCSLDFVAKQGGIQAATIYY